MVFLKGKNHQKSICDLQVIDDRDENRLVDKK